MERGSCTAVVLRCLPASIGANARIRTGGPALASLHTGDGSRDALQRFDELWTATHDAGPAVSTLLSRAASPSSQAPAVPRWDPGSPETHADLVWPTSPTRGIVDTYEDQPFISGLVGPPSPDPA